MILTAAFFIVFLTSQGVLANPVDDVENNVNDEITEYEARSWVEAHKGVVIGVSVGFVVLVILLCTCCCCCGFCCCRRDRTVVVSHPGAQGSSVVVAQQQSFTSVNPAHAGYNQ